VKVIGWRWFEFGNEMQIEVQDTHRFRVDQQSPTAGLDTESGGSENNVLEQPCAQATLLMLD
jgi:hypothetical protein